MATVWIITISTLYGCLMIPFCIWTLVVLFKCYWEASYSGCGYEPTGYPCDSAYARS